MKISGRGGPDALIHTLVHLARIWFLGYGLDDTIPDHCIVSKARKRWGRRDRSICRGRVASLQRSREFFRNARDRGREIGGQILGDLERGFRRLCRGLRELFSLRHRLQLGDRVDFGDATHEDLVAVGFKDPEVGINRVVVRAEVKSARDSVQ
jgi:hypothetical protein